MPVLSVPVARIPLAQSCVEERRFSAAKRGENRRASALVVVLRGTAGEPSRYCFGAGPVGAADSDTTSISYPLPFTLNFILSLLIVSSTGAFTGSISL